MFQDWGVWSSADVVSRGLDHEHDDQAFVHCSRSRDPLSARDQHRGPPYPSLPRASKRNGRLARLRDEGGQRWSVPLRSRGADSDA